MNRSKYIAVAAAAAMALTMAGCGFSGGEVVEVTPTPMATPTPTVISITATPLPTSTPAPKMIGKKTAQAKFIYLTNNLQNDIRELYLRVSGDDEGDWGNNLLSAETAFKAAEQVQMYYNGSSSDMSGQTDTENSTETSESSLKYDMKLVTADGSSYEIYSVDFGDMEKATLLLDQDGSSVYLRYMSLSTKKEADTRGNSVESSDENSDDSSSTSSDDASSDSSTSSYDTSSDSSTSDYDTSSDSSDSSYDTSSDDSSNDDSSSDDGDYDDGSYDDGDYDDSGDDGSYDDGSYDDGYVDEGSDGGDYDTDESSSSDWDY